MGMAQGYLIGLHIIIRCRPIGLFTDTAQTHHWYRRTGAFFHRGSLGRGIFCSPQKSGSRLAYCAVRACRILWRSRILQ